MASGTSPAQRYCQALGTEMVHKKLICTASDFFEKAFKGGFVETTKNQMGLPEDTPKIVSMFVAWLYNKRKLDYEFDVCRATQSTTELMDLYIFADAKRCNALKNTVMDAIQDGFVKGYLALDGSHVQSLFERTSASEDNPIRRFCVAWIGYGMLYEWMEKNEVSALFKSCPDALEEYLTFQNEGPVPDIYKINPEIRGGSELYHLYRFHVHGKGERCSSKKPKLVDFL
ncbi:hypothetical protein N431DRAFT_458468 [Stipitochalara longipes BDJ]|nr:hypothetical protein N431DRAFT_458468 [Stipitochalara longipes BDJ]